jgi:predicted lipid-binding transport protein (Tim44 family)
VLNSSVAVINANTTYGVRVAAVNQVGPSQWSSSRTFSTAPSPLLLGGAPIAELDIVGIIIGIIAALIVLLLLVGLIVVVSIVVARKVAQARRRKAAKWARVFRKDSAQVVIL